MTIEKLITEYKGKITELDADIESLSETLHLARQRDESTIWLREDRKIVRAKRQAYIQIIHDLDTLLA